MKQSKFLLILFFCVGMYTAHAQQGEIVQTDTTHVKVLFYLDKYFLTDSAKEVLNAFLARFSNLDSLNLDGYCDFRASLAYNDRLSENRIISVANYLKDKGFNRTASIVHHPHGKRVTLDARENESGYAQNRAVIITVVEIKRWAAAPPEEVKLDDSTGRAAPKPVDTVIVPIPPIAEPVTSTQPVAITKPADTVYVNDEVTNKDDETRLVEKIKGYIDKGMPGRSIVLNSVYFLEGRHVFVKTSLPVLDAVSAAIKAYPTVQFEIQGHVCCTDELAVDALDFDSKKFDLSAERAQAVHEYIVKNGVDESQIVALEGFGSRNRLVLLEKTEAARNRNRRVQLVIIKK